jgi:hypothetical protein
MALARVDALAAVLSFPTLGHYGAVRKTGRFSLGLPILAAIAFTAKQTAVAGILAAFLHRLIEKRFRIAILEGLLYLGLVLAFIGVASIITGGEYWLHAFKYNAVHSLVPIVNEDVPAGRLFSAFGPFMAALLLLGIVGAVGRPVSPLLIYALLSPAISITLLAKSGSNFNYFLEPVLAVSAAGAVGAQRVFQFSTLRSEHALAGPILVLAACLVPVGKENFGHSRSLYRRAIAGRTVPHAVRSAILASVKPPLLLGLLGSEAIQCGREACFDMADFVRLKDKGLWNVDGLLRRIRSGDFSVIGLPKPPLDRRRLDRNFDVDALGGLRKTVLESCRVLLETPAATYFIMKDR